MIYTRDQNEKIIIGTLLNRSELNPIDGIELLREEMFINRQCKFVAGIIIKMIGEGIPDTTPYDVYMYTQEKFINPGNKTNFLNFLTELSMNNFAWKSFRKRMLFLISEFNKDRARGKLY